MKLSHIFIDKTTTPDILLYINITLGLVSISVYTNISFALDKTLVCTGTPLE